MQQTDLKRTFMHKHKLEPERFDLYIAFLWKNLVKHFVEQNSCNFDSFHKTNNKEVPTPLLLSVRISYCVVESVCEPNNTVTKRF